MFVILALLGHNSLQAQTADASAGMISSVEYLYWNSPAMPPADALWRPMTLPFNTREDVIAGATESLERSYVWFRFPLQEPAEAGRYSLYFWRYNLSLTVFLNGAEIGGDTYRAGRTTMAWNHPLLVEIQQPAWHSDTNEVMVRLLRSPWGGNFAPVHFGKADTMQELWSARMFRQIEVNEILLAFGLSLTLISLILWVIRRRDPTYLWFSGMCLGWSTVTLHMIVYQNPIPYDYWLPLVHASIDGTIFCIYGFIGRLIAGVKRPVRERLFLVWTLVAWVAHFVVPPDYFWVSSYGFHLIGTLAIAAIVFRVAKLAWQKKETQTVVVATALMIQITLFLHNIYLMFLAPSQRWEGAIFYAHFGIPLLFLTFTGTLLTRFSHAISVAESLNHELEKKVELSRQVLEKTFAERRALEISQAAEQERLKIYRDLHDDVGSKLLSIIHADRNSKLGNMASSALESLRQAVSKANNPDQLLVTFLHDIREETELRLRGSGHDIHWAQNEVSSSVIIPSAVAFNLNRILKEIVSNIIRHAAAGTVRVDVLLSEHEWEFSIADDGKGFDREGPMGNGIQNIMSRADEIGAQVTWESGFAQGTLIHVVIPVCEPGTVTTVPV